MTENAAILKRGPDDASLGRNSTNKHAILRRVADNSLDRSLGNTRFFGL